VQQAAQTQQVQILGVAGRLEVPFLDQVALQLHAHQQRQVAGVRRVRREIVVEGVQLLQEDARAGVPAEEGEQFADRLLEPEHVELGGRVADDGVEAPPHAAVDVLLQVAQALVQDLFEKFQVPMADPDLVDPQLHQARHQLHGDLPLPRQQKAVGILRQGNGPGEDHPRLDGMDWDAEHDAASCYGRPKLRRPTGISPISDAMLC